MATIAEYYRQAELALAAYASLAQGYPDPEKLQQDGKGMSSVQANRFAANYTDPSSGFSATVTEATNSGLML